MEKEPKLLVIYIGVAGIRSEDIEEFVKRVTRRITPSTFNSEVIVIPVQSSDTRVECINPVYITEKELIEKHSKLMGELHEELEHQIVLLKNEQQEKD